MQQPILLIKYMYYGKNILPFARNFLGLTPFQFEGLITAILLHQSTEKKIKMFNYQEMIRLRQELVGKGDIRRYHGVMIFDELLRQGYLKLEGVKGIRGTRLNPVYSINQEKMNYFLSVICAFADAELVRSESMQDVDMSKIDNNEIKKQILEHIAAIKKMVKN